jgi:DNA-binding NarL/FixJ family response regulator
MFRASLAVLLRAQADVSVVGEYSSGEALIAALPSLGPVDLILLDIQLPGEDGISIASRFRSLMPDTRIILLSSAREAYLLYKALQAPVDGYVHKDDSPETLCLAIQSVLAGGCYFGQTVQQLRRQMGVDTGAFNKVLSQKEQEVLELLGQGLTNEDAAPLLGLSAETVQTHRRNIMRKLGLHNATQLQSYALKHGFTSISELR